MNKKKMLVFHPSLAPYRIDFFNSINDHFETEFYFFYQNLRSQKFDQEEIKKEINFECKYLKSSFLKLDAFKYLVKYQPDIIINSEYDLTLLHGLFYRVITKKKMTIATICDDTIEIARSKSLFKKIIRYFLLKCLDYVILTHQEIVDWYQNNWNLKPRLLLFPIIRKEEPFFDKLNISIPISGKYKFEYKLNSQKVVLFVGRLVHVKNIELLIEAFSFVAKENNNVVLIIVGSGELEHTLKEKIKNLKLTSSVIMPGRYEGIDLLAWYYLADIFILPSISEAFGAVINEALLAGCYTLVSNVSGGACLIKDNINGNIFDPSNKQEIVDILTQTLCRYDLFERPDDLKFNRMLISFDSTSTTLLNELLK